MRVNKLEKSITTVNLSYHKRPSTVWTVLLALWGRSTCYDHDQPKPLITATRNNIEIDKDHLEEFSKICEIRRGTTLPLMYPFTMIYPLLQRILAHKQAPFSMFRVLNSRIQVFQRRPIQLDSKLNITCCLERHRIREKGLEIEIVCTIDSAGEALWANTQTFFYKGKFGPPDGNYNPPSFNPIPDAEKVAKWYLPASNRMRFAYLSGDGNAIHYLKPYARLYGFKRDFAQPIMVLARAVEQLLEGRSAKKTVKLDLILKGQFYYKKMITLKASQIREHTRFDIYCEGNPLPCFYGALQEGDDL